MTRDEFNIRVRDNNIPDNWYHIFDDKNPYQIIGDSFILHKNDNTLEFYVIDERGGKNSYRAFNNWEESLNCLWSAIEKQLATYKKLNIKIHTYK